MVEARGEESEEKRRSRIVHALVESGSYAGTIYVNYNDRIVRSPKEG